MPHGQNWSTMRSLDQLAALGYPMPPRAPKSTVIRIKRTTLSGAPRPDLGHSDWTTHLRGPSRAVPTSGRGKYATSAWLKDNAERYGIVSHRGS